MTIRLLFKLMFVAIGGTFLSYGATDKNHQDPPCTFTINATKTDYVCFNENRGRIDVVSATGTAPYTYLWSNGATNSYISSVPAGTYSVVVTDSNGCTATESYTLESYTKVEVNATLTHVTCNGSSTGSIVIEPFGGSGTYTYVWTPSNQRVQNPVNLPAGVHLLNITDSNGCRSYRNFTITEPQPLTATATATTTSCTVNNGSAGVTVGGGTPPYTYLWSNGATTASINGLAAGPYTVIATDAKQCSIEKTVTVNNPSGITVTTTKTDVSCYGGPNGTIRAQVTGGVPGYTYLWNTGATTQEIQGLLAGSYTVTVTDANNCSATYTTVVSQPDLLISSVQKTNPTCSNNNDGRAVATTIGGLPPYTYLWSNGATTQGISNLSTGTYTVTVTDANSCFVQNSFNIQSPQVLLTTGTTSNLTCFGELNGTISSITTGGTPPYTYLWNTGETTADLNNLAAGSYTLTVTDANSCTATYTAVVNQPAALIANGTATNVSCNGGSNATAAVTITGGAAPYTYSWSNGATTANLNNLTAGSYTVTVTDANLCTATYTAVVNQPTALVATGTVSNVSCNGGVNGTASVIVTGGTAPYTYAWSNGATTANINGLAAGSYTLTVTDANACTATYTAVVNQPTALVATGTASNVSCNGGDNGTASVIVTGGTAPYTYAWSNGATTANINGLAAGSYTLTVTDANACTATHTAVVTQPTALVATGIVSNVSCNGGSIGTATVSVTGGTAPYTYAWSNGATTADINGLAEGSYTLTVSDANMCTATYTAVVNQPTALVATGTATPISCNGGSNGTATVTVTGGTAPYTYSWNNSETTASISGLTAGSYTVTVSDNNSCTATYTVVVNQPAALVTTGAVTQVTCNGGNNGTASVTVTGGTAPYTYAWSNGATTAEINGLATGSYTVTVTDANTCTATYNAIVTQLAAVSITSQPINQTVVNNGTVVFQVTAVNATTFTWYASTDGNNWSAINGAPFTGQDTASLTLTPATAGYNGYFVKVVINENTPCSITSIAAQLTVTNQISAVNDDYTNVAILEGDQITLGSVLNNDTLNGAIINPTEVVLSIEDANGINGLNLDTTGSFAVPTNLPFGSYNFVYKVCEVANPSNCATATVYFEITENLKVKDINKNNVTVYPNPAQATIQLNIDKEISVNEIQIEIFDINGRLVMSKSLKNITDKIDIVNLASGAYIIQLNLDHKKIQKKFIKIN